MRSAPKKWWWPTNKWWTLAVTNVATVSGLLWVGDGINTDEEKLTTIGLVSTLVLTWLVPNRKVEK